MSETTPQDHDLAPRVLAGDRDAFEPLVRRNEACVRALCSAMLGDSTEAQDAAQDVFLKAFRGLRKFRADAAFSTWLYRIARNHCLDLLKTRKRRAEDSLDALLEKGDGVLGKLPSSPPPSDSQALLSGLPSDYRAVLILREVHGYSYGEIAHSLEITLDSVKARLRRARQSLIAAARHFSTLPNVQKMETPHEPRNA